ncbi:MAG: hydrogenase maturation nickel metallochaperone HypA [Acidobacteria bacterium]|jgi:hydrogenase nickel incorporation protein HypA/HybF|nr:hydrogenase maturation nickel metallochaperone HypA [Acidobacteriota bacterium]
MHEYSLVRALADRVEEEARSRQAVAVHRLTVAIGAVSGVEPALFETAFSLCREGILADAELEIRRVDAAWSCPSCGRAVPSDPPLRCAVCGEAARLSGGDELILEQIEMEVP